ncbi:MAG TPA: hypothetical protein VHD36_16610 [Pirellulales bacterium]|nr:hypothetical protein [Pirellulales bacterium]
MRIIFEFVGGPRDGERLLGNADEETFTEAGGYYRHTSGATVGGRFWCTCEYTVAALQSIPLADIEQLELAGYRFRGHVYEIVARRNYRGMLVARAQHRHAAE